MSYTLQRHYGKYTCGSVPSDGEHKQICIENVNKQAQNSPVIKLCCYLYTFIKMQIWTHLILANLTVIGPLIHPVTCD